VDVEDYLRLVQRHRWLIVGFMLLGLVGGALSAAARSAEYQSQASAVIGSAAQANTDVGTAYNVAQTIRVSMPTYLALSTSTPVIDAASTVTGYPRAELAAGLEASNPPDTMVIGWTLKGSDQATLPAALAAVMDAFIDQVTAASPRNEGTPMIRAQVVVAAQPATRAGLWTPPLGGFAGGLAGVLVGITIGLLRMHSDHRVDGRKDVERVLALPVVAQIDESETGWTTGWTYLASFIARLAEPVTQVLLVGGHVSAPSNEDAAALNESLALQLRNSSDHAPQYDETAIVVRTMGPLTRDEWVAAMSDSHTLVVLMLRRRVDDLHQLLPSVENLKRATTAQLAAVIVRGPAGPRLAGRLVADARRGIRQRRLESASTTSE
jgi:capsular polysaccharide biosynthesis protein